MARPTKQGVDYFPLDVHLDNKFKFIEIKFGLEGFAIVIKMLQEIYSQGYFCEWGEDEKLLFSDEHKVDFQKLEEITNECLKREIFNKNLYEKHKILTSKGIQARYKEIVRRRKDVDVIEEYLLIDGSLGVNDDTMTTSSKQNDGKSTQSKGKENKLNNIYTIFEFWNEKQIIQHRKMNQALESAINAKLKDYELDEIIRAIDNYATVLKSDMHFFSYKWALKEFLNPKNFDKFLDASDPLVNFRKSKQESNPSKRQGLTPIQLYHKKFGNTEPMPDNPLVLLVKRRREENREDEPITKEEWQWMNEYRKGG